VIFSRFLPCLYSTGKICRRDETPPHHICRSAQSIRPHGQSTFGTHALENFKPDHPPAHAAHSTHVKTFSSIPARHGSARTGAGNSSSAGGRKHYGSAASFMALVLPCAYNFCIYGGHNAAILEELEIRLYNCRPKRWRVDPSFDRQPRRRPEESPEAIAKAWDEEIARRVADMEAGRKNGFPR